MKIINNIIGLIFSIIIFLLILSFVNKNLNQTEEFSFVNIYKKQTTNNLIIGWELTEPADGEVIIDSKSYKTYKIDKTHNLNISLCPLANGNYNYHIRSCNLNGKCITSKEYSFTANPNCIAYYCDKDLDGKFNSEIDGYCQTSGCYSSHCQETSGTDIDDQNPDIY